LDTVPRRRLKFRRRRYLLYLSPLTYKRFRDYLQGLRHQPVNGLFNFTKLKKPYNFILFYLFCLCSNPPIRLSRLEALFELSDVQATSEKVWKIMKLKYKFSAVHPTVKTVGFLAEFYVYLHATGQALEDPNPRSRFE
jgi:hypothetical protein